jgi:hypothetical protein
MGITCCMVRPNGALHLLALVNNGALRTDGNSVARAQASFSLSETISASTMTI